jgi:alpha-tubulin suppressor-like RCC1 family protein
VASGYNFSCALLTSGAVKCWGDNTYGQLGNNSTTSSSTPVQVTDLTSGVTAVSAGHFHACALLSSGAMKCWGYNYYGQLGDNTTTQRLTPTQVYNLSSGVSAISAGPNFSCAVVGGSAKCWGYNNAGQLGNNSTSESHTPVQVSNLTSGVSAIRTGSYQSCALLTSGAVKCWGDNQYGQLGNGTTTSSLIPVQVSGLTSGAASIALGGSHSCARLSSGAVKCWGSNSYGQIGNGNVSNQSSPVSVSGLSGSVTAISADNQQTCALLSSGEIQCWGHNYWGQLGNGSTTLQAAPADVIWQNVTATEFFGGGQHTCALTPAGGMKCWGNNTSGQLGNGTTISNLVAVDVTGLSSGVTAVAMGGSHTCALTRGGIVKCWGDNTYGQLGEGSTTRRTTPVQVSGLSGVIAISAGNAHTCALKSDGSVKCWGYNEFGQLGNNTTTNSSSAVAVSGLSSGVSAISTVGNHTCALLSGGGVKCWG